MPGCWNMRKKQYCAGFFRSAILVALAVLADSSATSRNPPAFRDAHRRDRREFLSGERAAALFEFFLDHITNTRGSFKARLLVLLKMLRPSSTTLFAPCIRVVTIAEFREVNVQLGAIPNKKRGNIPG